MRKTDQKLRHSILYYCNGSNKLLNKVLDNRDNRVPFLYLITKCFKMSKTETMGNFSNEETAEKNSKNNLIS
jgi:hypothetical protein